MLQGEHSAILSTCIKLPSVFKNFVLSIFECLFKTGFTVLEKNQCTSQKTCLYGLQVNPCPAELDLSIFENTVDPVQLASQEAI